MSRWDKLDTAWHVGSIFKSSLRKQVKICGFQSLKDASPCAEYEWMDEEDEKSFDIPGIYEQSRLDIDDTRGGSAGEFSQALENPEEKV